MPSDAVDDYWRLRQADLLLPSLADRVEEPRPRWMRFAECRGVDIAHFCPVVRTERAPGGRYAPGRA